MGRAPLTVKRLIVVGVAVAAAVATLLANDPSYAQGRGGADKAQGKSDGVKAPSEKRPDFSGRPEWATKPEDPKALKEQRREQAKERRKAVKDELEKEDSKALKEQGREQAKERRKAVKDELEKSD